MINNSKRCYQHMWGEKKRKVKRKKKKAALDIFSVLILKGLGFGLILLCIIYINNFFFFKLTTSSHDVPSNILKH